MYARLNLSAMTTIEMKERLRKFGVLSQGKRPEIGAKLRLILEKIEKPKTDELASVTKKMKNLSLKIRRRIDDRLKRRLPCRSEISKKNRRRRGVGGSDGLLPQVLEDHRLADAA